MEINAIQDEIIEEFSVFEDWMEKYSYLIELGNSVPPISEEFKKPENLIQGCQSQVWLNAEVQDGKILFSADSDAIITKGIVALLIKVYTNHTPVEILNTELYFIDKIGLKENLSPTRSNGLVAMIKQLKMYALAYKAKMK
ncbi:MAG: Fe-S metabolism protein SufE [Bacteroidetes bacterium RIFOXYA12_FULL_35_11]|nr:MAG: Fe-S metabolism protein SufE [Bacteroidetes bacterium GWF2_35_48]OFY79541.1 MAG: Fe-S metabolism protein SufE [Bacteroidetes bacterium RIFOXYA12_FULL_35_11]OFY92734.1 MAG: Fe-S metabolism protein SufE [Bacteroidetes bacterium RIFOXYC12_FULL_35_7]OFY94953.1 MAG: Fe-S metabolism protein SufE [Bacteroidetes bacterium RIFOXYB2_FULL_35_7]HBX53444.1 Fe-S metabolism protein SufE [Bacteroidales bacterium]